MEMPKKTKIILIISAVLLLTFLSIITLSKEVRAGIYWRVGNFYFGGGAYDLTKARYFYDKVIKNYPELPGGYYQRARVNFIEGNFDNALSDINQELTNHPDFKRSYYVRGLIYGYTKKLKEAEKDFLAFLDWKPNSWAGHNDLSWIYFQMGDFKKAEEQAREGLKDSPTNPWLFNSLGVALLNQARFKEAKYYLTLSLHQFENADYNSWGKAYPGNDPAIYEEGLGSTIETVRKNLSLIKEKG